jgi:3-dehydroquinate dehydratase type I
MICTSIKIKDVPEGFVLPDYVELAEYRFDDTQISAEQIKRIFSDNTIPAIACYRSDSSFDTTKFTTLENAILSGATYIDLEIDYNFEYSSRLVELARKNSVKVIFSYHNYFFTPDRYELEEIFESLSSVDADIIKIACKANNAQDVLRLLNLYGEKKNNKKIERKLISLPIGNEWKLARLSAIELGAAFIYASLTKTAKTADGQIDIECLITILDLLK